MLKHLYIKNFTLIDQLDIAFHSGFSVITGETGAGKSIILGAIGLLLGNRADSKQIKQGEKKCTIEAHFDLSHYGFESFFEDNDIDFEPEDTIIRRELTASGKSRAFINDTPVSLQMMRILGEQLIDIHSQHQNLLLQKDDFQLNVVDIIAQDSAALSAYHSSYQHYKESLQRLSDLKEQITKAQENEEFMRFQFDELESAGLVEGRQQELEQESETLSHSEDIKTAYYEADHLLNDDDNGIIYKLGESLDSLSDIENVYSKAKDVVQRLSSVHIELKDIASEVGSEVENIEFDPSRLDSINQQLDQLNTLEQKYHVSTEEELIEIRDNIAEQLQSIDNSDEELESLTKKVDEELKLCTEKAAKLTELRLKAGKIVEKEMSQRLIPLGIPNVRFKVDITSKPLSLDGADKVQFLFSANTSTAMEPVAQVASGGEIARVMLSLKAMISGTVKLPTIIFDEIDTGVSGKIAQKMALIMQEMGNNNRQVISITHLPQIAALGSSHYKVEKEETAEGTRSHMRELNQEERVCEIAQMLSGADISDAALQNARELLNLSQK
ncbi:DNA repair protein RecN [Prevotella veroralis]|uniref:DNA repair protein RecN n=1 Tax=Prevotella veroralis F0319 TaxID=649761 RepID=C9MQ88_9BACT|nr:DNA repair protein RecN [Prevotella veroralis]EEX18344.1 DNA repair protein RecN [Prevotella veroralis F0319]QUB41262.1 DNA repair protein RecN [Prevotella veroralis]